MYRVSYTLEKKRERVSGVLVSCRAFPGNDRRLNEQIDEHLGSLLTSHFLHSRQMGLATRLSTSLLPGSTALMLVLNSSTTSTLNQEGNDG